MKVQQHLFCLVLALVFNAKFSFSQEQSKLPGSLVGWWVNTQYDYYLNQKNSNDILNRVSPQFIEINSLGKCILYLLNEQRSSLGMPHNISSNLGIYSVCYTKKYTLCISNIRNNDSLIVISTNMTPGAGTIFKKYTIREQGTKHF